MNYGEETGLTQPDIISIVRKPTFQDYFMKNNHQRSLAEGALSAPLTGYEIRKEIEESDTLSENKILIECDAASYLFDSSMVTQLSPWVKAGAEKDIWDDNERPVTKLLNYHDLQLDEDESDGIVSDRIIASGLSYLCKCPVSGGYILAKIRLSAKSITDIDILGLHPFLQYVDLSWNNLTDLTPLGNIPYLMYLDVSHNQLTTVLRFKAPKNLTYVNYSYNHVAYIDDLKDFWSITKLNLSHNQILKIDGLQNLKFLRKLNLSFNRITCLENLNHLRLTTLLLENNNISIFEEGPNVGMKTLLSLDYINMSNNLLSSLAVFKDVYHLRSVEIQNNKVEELLEVDFLQSMVLLCELDLTNNPITHWSEYRGVVLNVLPSLTLLDGSHVSVMEKVAAKNILIPDISLRAACSHAHVLLLEQLHNHNIDLDILPVDQGPFPLVILVGPLGCKKGYLVRKLANKIPEKVRAGVSHTSRPAEHDEINGINYHFVSHEKFNELACSGMFLAITEILGYSYGFSKNELANCVQERKLCLTHMDLVGAMTLYNCSLQPRLVLVIPESKDYHLDLLRLKYIGIEPRASGAVGIKRRTLPGGIRASMLAVNMPVAQQILEEIVIHCTPSVAKLSTSEGSRSWSSEFGSKISDKKYQMIYQEIVTEDLLDSLIFKGAHKKGKSTAHSTVSFKYPDLHSNATDKKSSIISFGEESASQSLKEEQTIEEEVPEINYQYDKSTMNIHTVENEYIRAVLQTREIYFDLQDHNPGFFYETIYTDDLDKAYDKLYKFVKSSYISRPNVCPIYSMTSDNIYKLVIPKKMARFLDAIHKHHDIVQQHS